MIIKPKIKGFICVNAHPLGCQKSVENQIDYVESLPANEKPLAGSKKALIIGCSSGYGLASRVALSFGSNTQTIGVYFDREPTARKTASAGWYNNQHIETLAQDKNLFAQSLNMDAFQPETKVAAIELIKASLKEVDLVIYSVAAPRRYIPSEDKWYNSVLKPVGESLQSKSINTDKGLISTVDLEAATQDEIDATVKVMGGDDWYQWMEALNTAGVLSDNCNTIAYTYIGEQITQPIYGEATIGYAKKDLDHTAVKIDKLMSARQLSERQLILDRPEALKDKQYQELKVTEIQALKDKKYAYIGVLKALVTQSSSAIPVMPLYISLLYKVMKESQVHEGCIEQIVRLLRTGLYGDTCQIDSAGRLRVDEHELDATIQAEVMRRWHEINDNNLWQLSDFAGYKRDFFQLFGFDFESINYQQSVDTFGQKIEEAINEETIEGVSS